MQKSFSFSIGSLSLAATYKYMLWESICFLAQCKPFATIERGSNFNPSAVVLEFDLIFQPIIVHLLGDYSMFLGILSTSVHSFIIPNKARCENLLSWNEYV